MLQRVSCPSAIFVKSAKREEKAEDNRTSHCELYGTRPPENCAQ